MSNLGEVKIINGYYLPDMFSVVMPEATTNLITNPSFETNTTGYTAVGAGVAIARVNTEQRRGAYSLQVAPAAGVASGVYFGTVTTVQNEAYTFSLDVKGVAGHWYSIYFATGAAVQLGIAYRFQSNGYWQRVNVTYNENAVGAARRLYLIQDATADVRVFYTDGWQVENKSYPTTYCDGDLTGFVIGETAYGWNSTHHGSTSFRASTTRSGGRIVNLKDYGFNLLGSTGLGLAPVTNYSLPSNLGGAYYQNTINNVRPFTLIGDIQDQDNSILGDIRTNLESAFAHDITPYRQPLLLHFQEEDECGNFIGDEVFIKCLYEGGLERTYDNLNGEKIILRFTGYGKAGMWIDGNYARSIAYNKSYNHYGISYLDGDDWVPFGSGVSTGGATAAYVTCVIEDASGTLYIGGMFASVNGVAASNIAKYSNGAWSALGAGVDNVVYCMELRNGILYVGGSFNNAGGAGASKIAAWNTITSAWSALGAGLTGGSTKCCTIYIDSEYTALYAGGGFTTAGGVAANNIAKWTIAASTWSAIGAGTDNTVYDIDTNSSLYLYLTGEFTTAGGVTVNKIAKLTVATSAYSALGTGLTGTGGRKIIFDKNSRLIVGGDTITACGGLACENIAAWNGSSWQPMFGLGGVNSVVRGMAIDDNGLIHCAGVGEPPGTDNTEYVLYYVINPNSNIGNSISPIQRYEIWGVSKDSQTIMNCVFINSAGKVIVGGAFTHFMSAMANNYTNIIEQFPLFIIENVGAVSSYPLSITTRYDSESITFSRVLNITEKSFVMDYSWISNFENKTIYLSTDGSFFKIDTGTNLSIHAFCMPELTITNDGASQIGSPLLYGMTLQNTTNGVVYVSIVADGAGFYHVDFYSDAARTLLIGHTATYTAVGVKEVITDNNSGFSGFIYIAVVGPADVDIYITFPLLSISMIYMATIRSLSSARY